MIEPKTSAFPPKPQNVAVPAPKVSPQMASVKEVPRPPPRMSSSPPPPEKEVAPPVIITVPEEEEPSEDVINFGLSRGTTNTFIIPGMEEMSPEEYREKLQETVSAHQVSETITWGSVFLQSSVLSSSIILTTCTQQLYRM